ncbi:NAD(P)/FAD-dependent oxidoreductase [Nocardia thailandica]|uniref:NAD(P)/FAD-dependent oxidoreductase n=1 Tax=Nocardia thailandica TaxID=257275 RepID=A0ABW6PG47_9NOCA|nr:FAD-dependent oxidoreductase [Nocardia thailandica]
MKIAVIGAGYAGTIAANRLAGKLPEAELTVVNPRAEFVERVRLHEQTCGTGSAATPLTEMLPASARLVVDSVDKIGDGALTLSGGGTLDFDWLFLAVGSAVAPLPGTVAVGTWEGAREAAAALERLGAGQSVTVIGGGLTGIETAAEVAEARPDLRVRLVGSAIGASLSAGGQRRVRAGLAALGVEVVEDRVRGAEGGVVTVDGGARLASDLTLWAIIGAIPELAARSGLAVDADGRVLVDDVLRSVSDPRVFAVGDCAAVPGARLACATAAPQGYFAADTLVRVTRGRRLKPYSMGYAGQALSLGRRDALVQVCRRDDSPTPLYLAGRTAALTKESIVRYAKYGARTARYAWLPGR